MKKEIRRSHEDHSSSLVRVLLWMVIYMMGFGSGWIWTCEAFKEKLVPRVEISKNEKL